MGVDTTKTLVAEETEAAGVIDELRMVVIPDIARAPTVGVGSGIDSRNVSVGDRCIWIVGIGRLGLGPDEGESEIKA